MQTRDNRMTVKVLKLKIKYQSKILKTVKIFFKTKKKINLVLDIQKLNSLPTSIFCFYCFLNFFID